MENSFEQLCKNLKRIKPVVSFVVSFSPKTIKTIEK